MEKNNSINFESLIENAEELFVTGLIAITIIGSFLFLI